MSKVRISRTSGQGVFNTLEQSGTIIQGKGAEIGVNNKMKQWSKRKTITQRMMGPCIDIATKKGAVKRVKQYWQTYWCFNRAVSVDGYLHGKYCKNRFCTLCQSIRKAVIINKYVPVLNTWEQAYFVTLTIRAVRKVNLNKFMAGMIKAFQLITKKFRKRNQRGTGWAFQGTRSLECNFNPERKTYNPHFHVIVRTKEMAERLVEEWLKIWTPKWALPKPQKIIRIWDMDKCLIECVKYGNKVFTDPEVSKKKKRGNRTYKIYIAAFDNINEAIQDLRVFERFGFNLPKDENSKNSSTSFVLQFKEWAFINEYSDWFTEDLEAGLSGFIGDPNLENLLNDMDTEME